MSTSWEPVWATVPGSLKTLLHHNFVFARDNNNAMSKEYCFAPTVNNFLDWADGRADEDKNFYEIIKKDDPRKLPVIYG